MIDPDGWLRPFHRRIFKRRVSQGGSISIGRHVYYVGYQYAKEKVGVMLDADQRVFRILYKGQVIRELVIADLLGKSIPFQDYLKRMLEEARPSQTV
ncbi:MAG: hypothetical protein K8L97_19140 [Anaerolineae bacterium]|nr:hypothetical protein [Anaerolineae bacterium]